MRSPFVFAVCGYEQERVTDIWLCTPASRRGLCGRVADRTGEKAKKSSFPTIFTAFYANRRNAERKTGKRIFVGEVRQNGEGRECALNAKTSPDVSESSSGAFASILRAGRGLFPDRKSRQSEKSDRRLSSSNAYTPPYNPPPALRERNAAGGCPQRSESPVLILGQHFRISRFSRNGNLKFNVRAGTDGGAFSSFY